MTSTATVISTPPVSSAPHLVVDAHTLSDLEIFDSASGGTTLFDYCNLTHTDGGVNVLRRRMRYPWACAGQIRKTQRSILFIMENRQVFNILPGYITRHVEIYLREILMVVTQRNRLEFGLGALSIWAVNDRHYQKIVRGVQVASTFIRALRRFAAQAELDSAQGELHAFIEELRELLRRPDLMTIPERDMSGVWPWRILRIDQIFRIHETSSLARLLELTYEIDALIALADVTDEHQLTMPQVDDGHLLVQGENVVHPFVADAISNPVDLDQARRLLFLTGPNMAGKTTYLRAIATALYLGHMGLGVPASSFRFAPAQCLFSSITLSDDLRGGVSYFRAEALRVKAVAAEVARGNRVIAVMDEPFKGTNVKDALDASLAVMTRFANKAGCLFLFSSHLIELGEHLSVIDKISRRNFEADESGGRLRFDYRLRDGVSNQRLGVRVLQEEGVFDLLDGV